MKYAWQNTLLQKMFIWFIVLEIDGHGTGIGYGHSPKVVHIMEEFRVGMHDRKLELRWGSGSTSPQCCFLKASLLPNITLIGTTYNMYTFGDIHEPCLILASDSLVFVATHELWGGRACQSISPYIFHCIMEHLVYSEGYSTSGRINE